MLHEMPLGYIGLTGIIITVALESLAYELNVRTRVVNEI